MSDFEKLINASNLIEWIMETYPDWCVGAVRSIVDHVEDMPSAPSERKVEVVRCEECKFKPHWDEKTESAVFPIPDRCPCECDDYFYSWVPNDDWFCKDGERRET